MIADAAIALVVEALVLLGRLIELLEIYASQFVTPRGAG